MPGEAANRPLAPLQEAHLADAHLTKLLQSLLLPLCTADFITLLTVAAGELALTVHEPLNFEAVALVAPAGTPSPRAATMTSPAAAPNTSIYTSVSDLDDLELAHRFGIVMLPHVLLASTAAPRGLPTLLHHILAEVMNPRGGVALLGAIADTSIPLHAFLSAVAPGFVDARRLRQLVAESAERGVRVAAARRQVVWLRGTTVAALQRSLETLACLAGALEGSAGPCVGLGGGARPRGNPAVLGQAIRSVMTHVQTMHHGGGVGLPMQMEYLVVTKQCIVGSDECDKAALGERLVAMEPGPTRLSLNRNGGNDED